MAARRERGESFASEVGDLLTTVKSAASLPSARPSPTAARARCRRSRCLCVAFPAVGCLDGRRVRHTTPFRAGRAPGAPVIGHSPAHALRRATAVAMYRCGLYLRLCTLGARRAENLSREFNSAQRGASVPAWALRSRSRATPHPRRSGTRRTRTTSRRKARRRRASPSGRSSEGEGDLVSRERRAVGTAQEEEQRAPQRRPRGRTGGRTGRGLPER